MSHPLFERLQSALRGTVLIDEPLSRHTSWRIGGPAELFIVPADRDDLQTALTLLTEEQVPWLTVGAGSNLLVRDGGIRGAVIQTGGLNRIEWRGEQVLAEAGVWLPELVREAVGNGMAGLEELVGIPGSVGGAVVMNAGAGTTELGDRVQRVVLCGEAGTEVWERDRCHFEYRTSALPAGRVVVAVELQLVQGDSEQLTQQMVRQLAERRRSQSVGGPNAGSVFKNPAGGKAWELIDAVGWRGRRCGGAQVAEQHANFIVNRGGATAHDVLSLIEGIRDAVRAERGIEMELEVRIVGVEEDR